MTAGTETKSVEREWVKIFIKTGWLLHCLPSLPGQIWDGNLAELARQLGKLVEQSSEIQAILGIRPDAPTWITFQGHHKLI